MCHIYFIIDMIFRIIIFNWIFFNFFYKNSLS